MSFSYMQILQDLSYKQVNWFMESAAALENHAFPSGFQELTNMPQKEPGHRTDTLELVEKWWLAISKTSKHYGSRHLKKEKQTFC